MGKVKFNVQQVHESGYKTKDGDASTWPAGTAFYAVKGFPHNSVIAVKDPQCINGYRLYYDRQRLPAHQAHFASVPADKVVRVDIYRDLNRQRQWEGGEAQAFMKLLQEAKAPYTRGSPSSNEIYYTIALYTGEKLGYTYQLNHDGTHYYWAPSKEFVLPDAIGAFVEPPK